jgi:hypothetical protein
MGADAGVPAAPSPADSSNSKADALKKVCDEAYNYPPAATSCSHAVWYVLQKLINPKEPWRSANDLIDYVSDPDSKDWREVSVDDGWKLANEGKVVVGGKKSDPNGHVIVVYPGDKIGGGGYKYNWYNKVTKKTVELTMGVHGMLPRALSRSMGAWPGAISDGDKSVFDPWGRDDAFSQVKFWTMDKP